MGTRTESTRAHVDDPEQGLQNVNRVLLTRGRDGLVVFVPRLIDGTEMALLQAGVRRLPGVAGSWPKQPS